MDLSQHHHLDSIVDMPVCTKSNHDYAMEHSLVGVSLLWKIIVSLIQ
jgi:hypothetical protein